MNTAPLKMERAKLIVGVFNFSLPKRYTIIFYYYILKVKLVSRNSVHFSKEIVSLIQFCLYIGTNYTSKQGNVK